MSNEYKAGLLLFASAFALICTPNSERRTNAWKKALAEIIDRHNAEVVSEMEKIVHEEDNLFSVERSDSGVIIDYSNIDKIIGSFQFARKLWGLS